MTEPTAAALPPSTEEIVCIFKDMTFGPKSRGNVVLAIAGLSILCALNPARAAAPYTGILPRANCGANDRIETGLQGQTTVAERQSGASKTPYNCNLELVGQFTGEGANYQMAWYDNCAYYG